MRLPKLPTGKIWTNTKALWQDSNSSHFDFTAATFYQDIFMFGLPANHLIVGVKVNMLVEFVNGTIFPSKTMLYVGTPDTLAATPQQNGAAETPDAVLAHMNLSPTVDFGPTFPNTSYWFQVSGPGTFSGTGGLCKPHSFAAQDVIARFYALRDSQSNDHNISDIQQASVEIIVQYCSM